VFTALLLSASVFHAAPDDANKYFAVKVVDDETGHGVPLVELRTVNDLRYFTDSNGVVAFREPGLMEKDVFFYVASHGYEYPKDGFGIRGAALHVTAGGAAKLLANDGLPGSAPYMSRTDCGSFARSTKSGALACIR